MSAYDLEELLVPYEESHLFTFFDRDHTGDRLRLQCDELWFDMTHLPVPFIEVEQLPLSIVRQLLKEVRFQTKGGGQSWPIRTGR